MPFNAALEHLRAKENDILNQDVWQSPRSGRRKMRLKDWSVDTSLSSLLGIQKDEEGSKTRDGWLKKKLERDERRVLKKSSSKKLQDQDLATVPSDDLKQSSQATVATEVMKAFHIAVGNKEEPPADGLARKLSSSLFSPAEGRRRSAGPLAARRGSGLALKRGSVGGKEDADRRDSRRSGGGIAGLELCDERASRGPLRARNKILNRLYKSTSRMPARRLLRMCSPNVKHRSEAWLARETGLPLPVLQQALVFFKKHCLDYDGTNLFDARFDQKNLAKVVCEMAGVDNVEYLDRTFWSEAFRQANFHDGGMDCMEFVVWYAAFGFSNYFCVQKEDLPYRSLARKLGVDYIELERYKEAFEKYDEDGSGAIDMDEFESLLNDLLKVPAGHTLSAERVMVLWRDADREGEGELDLEAFCHFFKRHFEQAEDCVSDYYRSIRRIPTATSML